MTNAVFQSLVDRQSARVFRLCFSYVKNTHDAEDLMQEVFLCYLKSAPDFENERAESAWFLKVAANAAKSHLRKMRLRQHTSIDEITLSESVPDEADRISVLGAVLRLPKKQRMCIHLYYYEERSQAEIAKILSCPVSTVKSHLRRARAALAEILGETP